VFSGSFLQECHTLMAVDVCCMEENLRWASVDAQLHLGELSNFSELNDYMCEFFDPPAPAANTLSALAILMAWSGDSKQVVTKITGQRHTDDPVNPARVREITEALKSKDLSHLSKEQRDLFHTRMTEPIAWQKFDHETDVYVPTTPMNSYDVLKCSQACFHLFEWLAALLSEDMRPPRYVDIDMRAFRLKKGLLHKASSPASSSTTR